MLSLCFVCLGNICRSPTAEGVMLHSIEQRGLQDVIEVDSAGTANYHPGDPADSRSAGAALKRGIRLPSRARQFQEDDFDRFDYVLCMDVSNYESLLALSGGEHDDKLYMMLDFEPNGVKGRSVPDPYYGGEKGFERVLDLCFSSCEAFLDFLMEEHGLLPHRAKR